MNTKTIVAVLLIALGIVVLAYSGITFKTPGKPVDFLGMHFETTDSHFIPPARRSACARRRNRIAACETQAGLMNGVESGVSVKGPTNVGPDRLTRYTSGRSKTKPHEC